MKYCPKCSAENPVSSRFCMNCGDRFFKEAVADTYQTSYSPSPNHGVNNQKRVKLIASGVQHVQYIPPVREKYGDLIFSSNYNLLALGALVFGLIPLISIGKNLFKELFVQKNSIAFSIQVSILFSLFGSICFGFFIYGIYVISQESMPMNKQLSSVPIYLTIYVVGTFLTGLIFDSFVITETMSLEQVRNMVNQGFGLLLINTLLSFFLLLGAIKFTHWFEEFVTILGAPYNGPTNRFKWFGILNIIFWALLALTYFRLLIAFDNMLYDSVNNASIYLMAAGFFFIATEILQILSGYKIYSVLNNIRQGKYDETYQQNIMNRYQS